MKLLNSDISRDYLVGDVVEDFGGIYFVVKCPLEEDADDGKINYKYGLVDLTHNALSLGGNGKLLFDSLSELTSEFKNDSDRLLTGKLVFTPNHED